MIIHCLPFYEEYNNNTYYTLIVEYANMNHSLIQQVQEYIYNDIMIISENSEYMTMLMRSKFGV